LRARGQTWDAKARNNRLQYRDSNGELDLPLPALPGFHQARNASLAIAMLRHQQKLSVSANALAKGLETAKWPGRLQLLAPGPLTAKLPGRRIWLDGGHNRGGALAIARQMADLAPFDLIFALTSTRRISDVLGPLAPLVRKAHTIPLPGHPHHDPRDIAALAQARVGPRETYPAFTLDQAIDRLARDPKSTDDVLIFGSLYLAGAVLAANGELPD
jgi:dihydrofolate synthase/folylpolyglutamate synthase